MPLELIDFLPETSI